MSYLATQRALTRKYIEYDPTEIALIPYVETPTATGGYTRSAGAAKPSQTFKKIAQALFTSRPIVTVAGVERVIDYVLLGEWDSDMEVGDHWVEGPETYEILSIVAGHGYEKKAFAARKLPR